MTLVIPFKFNFYKICSLNVMITNKIARLPIDPSISIPKLTSQLLRLRSARIAVDITNSKKDSRTNGPIENTPKIIRGMSAPVNSQVAALQRLEALVRLKNIAMTTSEPIKTQSSKARPGSGHKLVSAT